MKKPHHLCIPAFSQLVLEDGEEQQQRAKLPVMRVLNREISGSDGSLRQGT